MITIPIKYWPGAHELEKISKGDWIDLYTYETVHLGLFESTLIPLGVAMKLPAGCEAHMAPRSSTFKQWGLIQTNSVAVIDNSYCGDDDMWRLPVFSTRPDVLIPKDTRLCQFRIIDCQPAISFDVVEHLQGQNRGGFGSTGV